jgi:NADPH-dependent F420 reductase
MSDSVETIGTIPTIAIIGGSGELGQGLTMRFARAGVPLIIGSRTSWTGREAAEEILEVLPEAAVDYMLNPEAAASAQVVFLAVPFAHHASTIASISGALAPGQIVVDAVVPLAAAVGGKATRTLGVWQGSAAEQARDLLPNEVGVVSALHTVSGAMLANQRHSLDEDVLVCGDSREDKRQVIELIERIDGLRAVDCGRLEQARIVESMTALLIGINIRNKTHAGIRITGLPDTPPARGSQALVPAS